MAAIRDAEMLLEELVVGIVLVGILPVGAHEDHSANVQHEGSQNRDL